MTNTVAVFFLFTAKKKEAFRCFLQPLRLCGLVFAALSWVDCGVSDGVVSMFAMLADDSWLLAALIFTLFAIYAFLVMGSVWGGEHSKSLWAFFLPWAANAVWLWWAC
jgi:hypothetical protein